MLPQKLAVLCSITHPSRVHDIRFFRLDQQDVEYLLVGAEDNKVSIYEVPMNDGDEVSSTQPKIVGELIGHQNRYESSVSLPAKEPPLRTFYSESRLST